MLRRRHSVAARIGEQMQFCQTGKSFQAGIRYATSALALAALCTFAVPDLRAQAAAPTTPSSAPAKKLIHHKRKAKQAPEPVAQVPVQPVEPPKPKWPVNDPSQPAHVNWDGRDLTVTATNASLSQVLHEVASATGLKVDGLDSPSPHDQRIYGSFGPAPARDVLNQLLEGSGYNSILIGDRGAGNPRELILTAQAKGASSANKQLNQPNQNNEDDAVDEPEPEQPEPQRPQQGPPPPGARPAQQYLQDLRNQQQQQQLPPTNPGQQPTQTPQN